jgi:hypothetical protein
MACAPLYQLIGPGLEMLMRGRVNIAIDVHDGDWYSCLFG